MTEKMTKEQLQSLYDAHVVPGIRKWKTIYGPGANDDLAFLLWATDLVLDDLELGQEEIIAACRLDGKWDLKVDSAYTDRQNQRIYLIQAKHWNSRKSIGNTPLIETWAALDLLSNEKQVSKANRYTKEFYIEFCDAVKQHYEVKLCLATSGRVLQPQKDYAEKNLENSS